MALTKCDVEMWAELAKLGVIPNRPRLLEIGEANWYGDVPPAAADYSPNLFEVAKKFYKRILDPSATVAIDFQGPTALPLDLNSPITIPPELPQQFDVIINTGTLEHVFNQAQAFRTIHELCAVAGLMMHAVPSVGWPGHGFYNYQDCLFADLAAANHYEILHVMRWKTGVGKDGIVEREDEMIYVAMRKCKDVPFTMPFQSRLGLKRV